MKEEIVRKETLKYFNNDKMLSDIFINKYLLFDQKGNEYKESSPNDTFERLAKEFYRIECKYPDPISYDTILHLLKDFKYVIPGGSILYGVGNDYSYTSLGNCFVIGTEVDSYGGIYRNDEQLAQLMKRRAGVGLDISFLRPAGAVVSNSARFSTGAISFMNRFSNTTREVAQDGRRGALLLSIDIKHPDVDEFTSSKDDLTKITGANISIKLSDDFIRAVRTDQKFYHSFPINIPIDDIYDPYNENKIGVLYKGTLENTYYKISYAKDLWNKIIHYAWKNAEPGLLFWDSIIRNSPADIYSKEGFNSLSTNPCGEIPLCSHDSCRLISINLYSFVENPFKETAYFNWYKFKEYTQYAQKLMDDVVDLEAEKIDRILEKIQQDHNSTSDVEWNLWIDIKKKLQYGRRTGLSGIGLADALAALGFKYDSDDGISMVEHIYKELEIHSYISSVVMAKDRGKFPICDVEREVTHPFVSKILNELPDDILQLYYKYGRRNIANTTVPPSGTIALMAGISSGIEPVFQIYYTRRRKINPNDTNSKIDFVDKLGDSWEEYKVFHPKFVEWYNNFSDFEVKPIQELSSSELNELITISPYHGQTANEINPFNRIKIQSVIQDWVCHSLSVTYNLPSTATEEEVSKLYMNAWQNNLKGITIYREGSRSGVLISNENEIIPISTFKPIESVKRPKELPCHIHRLVALKEKWIVLIGILDDNPYEIFALKEPDALSLSKDAKDGIITKVKRGSYKLSTKNGVETVIISNIMDYMPEGDKADTRKYSLMLRHRIHPKFIVEQIDKFSNDLSSFDKALSRVLKSYIKDGEEKTGDMCPVCSSKLVYENGCASCKSCGWAQCT